MQIYVSCPMPTAGVLSSTAAFVVGQSCEGPQVHDYCLEQCSCLLLPCPVWQLLAGEGCRLTELRVSGGGLKEGKVMLQGAETEERLTTREDCAHVWRWLDIGSKTSRSLGGEGSVGLLH